LPPLAPLPKIHEILESTQRTQPPPPPTYQSRTTKTARTSGREILAATASNQYTGSQYPVTQNKIYPFNDQSFNNKGIVNNVTTNLINNSVQQTKSSNKNKMFCGIGGCFVVILVIVVIGVIVALVLNKSSSSSSGSIAGKYIITLI